MAKKKVSFEELLGLESEKSGIGDVNGEEPNYSPDIVRNNDSDLSNLHPPIAPKIMEIETEWRNSPAQLIEPMASEESNSGLKGATDKVHKPLSEVHDSKPAIDFHKIANASEFQRFIYWILTGETFRGSNKALKMKLHHVKNKIEMVRRMPPELLQELKEKIKNRRVE